MSHDSEDDLERLIAQAYHDGQARYGDLGLANDVFKAHVLDIVKKHLGLCCSTSAALCFIKNLHTTDLYLSIACAQGSESAWSVFNATYRKYIRDLAAFTNPTPNAFELADSILVDLYLPNHSGHSRIASFEGRSSLATWLRIVVGHRVINEHERTRKTESAGELLIEIGDDLAQHTLDVSLRACRYEHIVDESFRRSCLCLTDRERLILLLRFDEELQLGEIARLLGVHQSTITRQLDRACKKLREVMITTLATTYRLNQAAISECQEDILENPAYSFLNAIKSVAASK